MFYSRTENVSLIFDGFLFEAADNLNKLILGEPWVWLRLKITHPTGILLRQCHRKPLLLSQVRALTSRFSRCNVPPPGTDFFGITHDRMVHVSDLRVLLVPDANHTFPKTVGFYSPVSQEPFYSGLGLFQLALDEWLPCFGQDFTA
jgi:hypothetical protein